MRPAEAAARELVGARFRPQGRVPAHGLDCIGVAMIAAGVAEDSVRRDYPLHAFEPEELHAGLARAGLVRVDPDRTRPGDVVVARPGAERLHLAVLVDGGFVHADAGLRRVVEVPGALPWPLLSAWRRPDAD
ncbi:MAG: peptidoglycan endopeptidase [Allosphingosinicella sp.]|uniref:peptidoglycan endopeptidase n=1 Tax=Allosphingosinicella sp. TaxID=2823234 RepID=UPI003953CC72